MPPTWTGADGTYTILWGGRPWELRVGGPAPGLYAEGRGPLLGLDGVAARGRLDREALSGATLTGCEVRHGRVEATFAPPGWSDLLVRAAWSPADEGTIDLELQVGTSSVGELRAVELRTRSSLAPASVPPGERRVAARDARCAALAFDGRDPEAARYLNAADERLAAVPPWCGQVLAWPGWCFVDLAHPDDVSRRVADASGRVSHSFFGYDLEKGVVLRGRERGVWCPHQPGACAVAGELRRFLESPLPLGT
jgi:hypothetical protein